MTRAGAVAGLGAGLALGFALWRRGLGIDRALARRRVGVWLLGPAQFGLELGNGLALLRQVLRHGQQHELEQIGVDGRKALGLLFGENAVERRAEKRLDFRVQRTVHTGRIPRLQAWRKSEFSESQTFFSHASLQTSEVLRSVLITPA